ncbi:MAG: PLDc N-terminal domain-containing protein, partial [Hungatella sp.]
MAIWDMLTTAWGWAMENLLYINLILSVVIVFFQRRDPKAVWTWLLVLYFIPIFGFFLYLMICQDYRKSKMFRVKGVEDKLRYSVENQEEALMSAEHRYLSDERRQDLEKLVLYNLESSGAVLTVDNT